MKRLLAMLLALVMILSMIPMTALPTFAEEYLVTDEVPAEEPVAPVKETTETPAKKNAEALASGTCGDDLTWKLEDGVLTISGTGNMPDYRGEVWNDATEDFERDTPWGNYASSIYSVQVEEGVTSIGNKAFFGCLELTQVTLADSVTGIGKAAFMNCDSLTEVTLSSGLVAIGDSAFADCNALTGIAIPAGVTSIGNKAFAECTEMTAIAVENGNENYVVSDGVLYNKDMTTLILCPGGYSGTVSVPEGVETVSEYAFQWCGKLIGVTLPDSLKTIDDWAFAWCTSLEELVIPDNVTTVGERAFNSCWNMTALTVGAGVTGIGDYAFSCSALNAITFLGDAPEFVGSAYEDEDGNLIEESMVFEDVTATAYYPAGNATWTEEVMQDYGGDITWVPCDEIEEPEDDVITGTCGDNLTWVLEDGVLTISGTGAMTDFDLWQQPWADYSEVALTVIIEEGVTTVGTYAFHGFSLKSVSLPSTLKTIGGNAFYGAGLKQIQIPYGVTSIGDGAFYGYGLNSLTVPGSVKEIGTYAFCCGALTEVTLEEGVEIIGKYAFEACEELTSIQIPASVTQILDSAFGYCSVLSEITFSGNAPRFADNVFEGLTTTVYYPSDDATWDSVVGKNFGGIITWSCLGTSAPTSGQCGDNVYWALENGKLRVYGTGSMWDNPTGNPYWLTNPQWVSSVTVEEGVTSVGCMAFMDCTNLGSVTFPGTLTFIGGGAFNGCPIENLTIPAGVTEIGECAFWCVPGSRLKNVTVHGSPFIGDKAFGGANIDSVTFTGDAPSFGEFAFEGASAYVYYPASNPTWDGPVGNHYGGAPIWCPDGVKPTRPKLDEIAEHASGTFGDCQWVLYTDGLLQISSIGDEPVEMSFDCAPWFGYYSKIWEVSIGGAITGIHNGHLFNLPLVETITIGSGVSNISSCAFSGATLNLHTVYFEGDAPNISDDAFTGVTADVYYPAENDSWDDVVNNDFGGDLTWKEYVQSSNVIDSGKCGKKLKWSFTDDGVLTISGSGAMYNYGGEDQPWYDYRGEVKSIIINKGATKIGDAAFIGCRQATKISIPNTVTRIGHSAFYGCSSLTSVVVPKGVETLGETAFAQCHTLKTAVLPDSLTTFYSGIFQGCFELESVTLPKGLKEIPVEMFASCKLTNFEIPKTITKIRDSAFASCQAGELRIPESVTLIEMYAFRRIEEITLIFEGDAPMFGEECFSSSVITAYYPVDNKTWTSNVMQQYDGEVTWIPYCKHNDANIVGAEEATCTVPGYTGDIVCPDCGETTYGSVIPATGHDFGEWYVEVPNGYMTNGEEHRDCKNCNHYESRVLEFTFTLEQVQNVRASSNKTSVKLTYDQVTGADRYEIWVDGERVATTSKTSYTVEDLTQGVNYEFVVVARDSRDDNYFYGPGSEPVVARPYQDLNNGYKLRLNETEVIYDGQAQTPGYTVRKDSSGKHDVEEGVDYTVAYENNVDIGTATVTVTGIGKFGGTLTRTFDILPDQVQNLQVEVLSEDTLQLTFDAVLGAEEYWIYIGGDRIAKITETTYTVSELKAGKTYKFSVRANTVVDGENYTGESSESDAAKPVYRLEGCAMEIKHKERAYTGKSRTNSFNVKNADGKTLKEDTDYEVVYENNKNVGTATATIIGKGKYAGTMTVTYDILPAQMDKPKAKVEQLENGSAIYMTFDTVPQAEWFEIWLNGEKYETTEELGHFTQYLAPGEYNITVRAGVTINGKDYIGEFSDARKVTVRHSVEYCTVKLEEYEFAYTGKSHKPAVTVYGLDGEALTEDVDYTLSYKNNKSTGKAYVEIKGKGNYDGSVKEYFTIDPAQVTGLKVSSTTKSSVKISFKKDSTNSTKYYNVYVNGEYVGRTTSSSYTIRNLTLGEIYSVYVEAEKTVSGTVYYGQPSETLEVWPGTDIGGYKVILEYTKAAFTGEPLMPTVTVKISSKKSAKTLVQDVDYTVWYHYNADPAMAFGKQKVTVTGIGQYAGIITKTFTVVPPQVTNVQAEATGKKSISVTFDTPLEDYIGNVEYWVYVDGSRKAKVTQGSCEISGLKAGRTYKITVKAVAIVDGENYAGAATDPVKVQTLK